MIKEFAYKLPNGSSDSLNKEFRSKIWKVY